MIKIKHIIFVLTVLTLGIILGCFGFATVSKYVVNNSEETESVFAKSEAFSHLDKELQKNLLGSESSDDDEKLLCIAIFPSANLDSLEEFQGKISGGFYYEITHSGDLITKTGTITKGDITKNDFLKDIELIGIGDLPQKTFDELCAMAESIPESEYIKDSSVIDDSFDIYIYYKGKICKRHWGDCKEISELVGKVLDLAPIERYINWPN